MDINAATGPRVALYSHDTQGLGHIRRNTLLAAALVRELDARVLLVTGTEMARRLPLPPQTEVLSLPGVRKHSDGHYGPREPSATLAEVIDARSRRTDQALRRFDPDLLIVDKVPHGIHGDLRAVLTRLAAQGRTRTVLGLRDVLDSAPAAVREWRTSGATQAVDSLYDEVWVYGDPDVYDPVTEYRLPPTVASKVRFTGYLAADRDRYLPAVPATGNTPVPRPDTPYVLCLVGGGQDGAALAGAFAQTPLPAGHHGLVVTGPFLPPEDLSQIHHLAEQSPQTAVTEFVPDVVSLARHASATVTMGGYNSVCETLGAPGPVLVAPRTFPRREQQVRADRLAEAGLVDVLAGPPDPARVGGWLARRAGSRRPAPTGIQLDGLQRVPNLARTLLDTTETTPEVTNVAL